MASEAQILANRRNAKLSGSGRPKGSLGETKMYAIAFKEYVAKVVEQNKAGLIEAMLEQALNGKIEAFNALLDRAHGKPSQALELGDTDGNPIVFMPLELIQKHALKVIEVEEVTPIVDNNVNGKQ